MNNSQPSIRISWFTLVCCTASISSAIIVIIGSVSQQKAPTPKRVCFYNGTDNKQNKIILKLSDAFEKNSESDIEVKVTMININKKLMSACKPLNEYAWFVDKICNSKTNIFEESIDRNAWRVFTLLLLVYP